MTLDITPPTAKATSLPRVKSFALRLPRGLADQIEARSKLNGESMNQHIVQAVRLYLGEGGLSSEARIAQLEEDVTRAVTAFGAAADELEGLKDRLGRLERLARQSGADI